MRRNWTFTIVVTAALVATVTSRCPGDPGNPIPKGCPEYNSRNETVHLAHEWDCTKFYKCDWGERVLFDCPMMSATKRLHFNPSLQVCDWPQCAGCSNTNSDREPYPGDCTKYYEIINGQKIPKDCPAGLHFSPTAKECMRPEDAGCQPPSPCDGVANGTPVAHENECNKYYLCVDGNASPRQCPEGLHFSKTLRICVKPEIACCNYTAMIPFPGDCTKYYDIVNCCRTPRNCPNGFHFSPTEKVCVPPDEAGCQPQPGPCDNVANGTPVADETDCSKYYVCNDGNLVPQQCPNGLHFSKTLHRCVEPEIACCNYTALEPYPGDCTKYYENINCQKTPRDCPYGLHFSPTEKVCMPPNEAGCQQPPGSCDNVADGTSVADETDCSKYYVCNGSNAIPQQCPNGLHFSKTLHRCVEPEMACCNYTALEPYPGDCTKYYENINCQKTLKDCPYGLHFSPTEKVCMPSNEAGCQPPHGRCDNVANGTPVADETDCSKYYVCNGNNAIPQQCHNGLHFSKTLHRCVEPEMACCNYTSLEPYPGDCTKYYENINCQKTLKDCPYGLHFSPTEKVCMAPNEAGCQPQPGPCDNVANGTPVADETDCSKYYVCNDGNLIPQQCPNGLHFSKTLYRCVEPEMACCNYTSLEPYPGDCTKYYENINCHKTLKDCPYGLHFSPTEKICMAPNEAGCQPQPGPCDNVANGTPVADETDCSKYYVCNDGNLIPQQCPNGLHFSKTLHRCVEPEMACCNYTALEPYPGDCTKYYENINCQKTPRDCPYGLHFSPTEKVCMPPNEAGCQQPPGSCDNVADGTSVADETDCSKYYVCNGSNAIPQQCPNGLHFSKTLHRCVEPEMACCNYTALEPYPADCTKYYENINCQKTLRDCPYGLHFSPTEKVCMPPNEAGCQQPPGSCENVADGTSVADETDCSKYYVCNGSNAIPQQCPNGLHFSKTVHRCVEPEIACCNYTALEPYPGDCTKYYENINCQKTPKNCPYGLHFSPTEKVCVPPDEAGCQPSHGPCDNVANGTSVADETDCSKYYVCNGSNAIPQQCPNGLHFSKTLHRCVEPEIACCNYTSLEPYPGDCTKYYENINCKKTPRDCPDGLHFSPTAKKCMLPEQAGCQQSPDPCDGIANGTSVGYDCDCSQYILCLNGNSILKNCPAGLYYSKILHRCVEPDIAGCNVTEVVPYPGNCSKYYSTVGGIKIEKNCPRGLHFSPTEKKCMPPLEAKCECDGGISGGWKVPVPCDCTKYFLCEGGDLLMKNCPKSLYFSEALQKCVPPEDSGCTTSKNCIKPAARRKHRISKLKSKSKKYSYESLFHRSHSPKSKSP